MMGRLISALRGTCQLVSVTSLAVSRHRWTVGVTWCRHVYIRHLATTSGIDTPTPSKVAKHKEPVIRNSNKRSNDLVTNPVATAHPVTRTRRTGEYKGHKQQFRKFEGNDNYNRKPYQHNRFEDGKFGQNNVRKPYQDNRFEDGKFGHNNVRKPYQDNRFEDGKFDQNYVRKPYQHNRFEDGKFGQNNVRKPYQDNRFEDGKFGQNNVRKPFQDNRFEDGKFDQNYVRKPYQHNRFEDGKFGHNNVRKPYQDNRFEDGKFDQNNVRKPYQHNRFEDGKFDQNDVRKPYQHNRFEDGKFDQNNVRNFYNTNGERLNTFSDGQFNGVKGGDMHREEPRVLSDDNSTVRQRSSVYSRAGSDVHRSPVVRRIPATDSRPEEATDLRYTWEQLPDEDKFGTGGRKTSSVTTTRPSTATGPPHGQAPISGHPAKWSDVFGTQTRNGYRSAESRVDDEPNDEPPHIPLSATNRRHVHDWYGRRIQKLGKRGQVKESLAMLEDQMMKQDRVKPRPFEFRAAIGTLANVGFTSKAFKLFKQMGRMDIRADHHTYTSLFNACAHSPYKDYGLREADWLYNHMKEKKYKPQYITYQAMIKAFGMCGDLETAFHVADQCSQQYRVTVNLLSSLLVACLSNRDTGLRHAIMFKPEVQSLCVAVTGEMGLMGFATSVDPVAYFTNIAKAFLIGTIEEVNRKISRLDRKLQQYTQLVVESRASDYSDKPVDVDYSFRPVISNIGKEATDKKEAEQKKLNRFAGYFTLKQTLLPGRSERVKNISKISMSPSKSPPKKETGKPKFVEPHYRPEFENLFYSPMSQAVFQDIFWYLFLDRYQASKNAQLKLFNRTAFNYVKLMMYVRSPIYRDVFFKDYPLLISQAVYTAYCHCFPDSYRQFGEEFREALCALVYGWIAGIKPAPRCWLKWNMDKLEPANIKMREEILNAKTKKSTPTGVNFDFLDSLFSSNISPYPSTTSLSQSNYSAQSAMGRGRHKGRARIKSVDSRKSGGTKGASSSSSSSHEAEIILELPKGPSPRKTDRKQKPVDPRKLIEALTPIRETTFEDYDDSQHMSQSEHVLKMMEAAKGSHKPKIESHPVGKGPDTVKSVYNIYGQSPLMAHFMRMKNVGRDAGQVVLVQRTEQENLPSLDAQTYQDLLQDCFRKVRYTERQYHEMYEASLKGSVEFGRQQRQMKKDHYRRQKALLAQPNEVKRLSDLLILELRKDPDSLSSGAGTALEQALLAQN